MKGGFYGLKVTQVSLILIAFVCIAVLGLAWTKTSLLTSLNPPQNHVLRLSPGVYLETYSSTFFKLFIYFFAGKFIYFLMY